LSFKLTSLRTYLVAYGHNEMTLKVT